MLIHIHSDSEKLTLVNEVIKSVCPYCKTSGDIRINVLQPYVRVFFIPGRPLKKEITATCLTCGKTFTKEMFTENLNQRYEGIKKRAPLWMYSALIICALLMVAIVFIVVYMKRQEAIAIQNPKAGDVYTIKLENNQCTLIKVAKTQGDSVFVVQSQYVMGNNNNVYGALFEKPYFTELSPVHIQRLKEWYDENKIVGVVTAE